MAQLHWLWVIVYCRTVYRTFRLISEKIFKINYNTLEIYTTSQPVGLLAKLLSVYGLKIFLLLHMSWWWLQDCTSGQFINVAAEQTDGMTDLRFTQRSHWTLVWQQFGSDFTTHCCVVTDRYSNKLVTER